VESVFKKYDRSKRRNNLGNDLTFYESDNWIAVAPLDTNSLIYHYHIAKNCLSAPEMFPEMFKHALDISQIAMLYPKNPKHNYEKYDFYFAYHIIPNYLIRYLCERGALTEALKNKLLLNGFSETDIENILNVNYSTTSEEEYKIWTIAYEVTGPDLIEILEILQLKNDNLKSLADLMDPTKLFPNEYLNFSKEFFEADNIQKRGPSNLRGTFYLIKEIQEILQGEYEIILEKYLETFPECRKQYEMYIHYENLYENN
jgi:hypothetical protein